MEVLSAPFEIVLDHIHIVLYEGVINGEVPIVVFGVRSGLDYFYYFYSLGNANYVLYCLTFVILVTSGLEEVYVAVEPFK